MKNEKLVYGIDFGTSNSAVSIINNNGKSEVLKIGNDGCKKTIPSLIFFPESEKKYYIGFEAISKYIESGMKGRFMQSIKSVLPSDIFSGTLVDGFGILKIENLISFILKDIKEKADKITNTDTKDVILGRPARFSSDPLIDSSAEKRLFEAAKMAGFENIIFQLEPIAAALHYESLLKKEELVLVVDIGGGTSDFTIMKLSPEKRRQRDRKSDILASSGVYIGGDTFDSDIMRYKLLEYFGYKSELKTFSGKLLPFPNHILFSICRWQEIGFMKNRKTERLIREALHESTNKDAILRLQSLINEDLGYSLFREIEKAKINLSNSKVSFIDFNQSKIEIKEEITLEEFENSIIQERLELIDSSVDNLMKSVDIPVQSIDAVFITGGSSLIPAIKNIFIKKFGDKKIVTSDSFTSVVSGLALSSNFLF